MNSLTPLRNLARGFATSSRRGGTRSRKAQTAAGNEIVTGAPPPAVADEWTEVKDPSSGLVYYWNQQTNETTALGEPKPGPEGTCDNLVCFRRLSLLVKLFSVKWQALSNYQPLVSVQETGYLSQFLQWTLCCYKS